MGRALAEALNAQVRSLAAAGCRHIRVDEPVFARKPRQALEHGIEHLEAVFHGVPEEVQRIVHMCCGYPSALDVPDYPIGASRERPVGRQCLPSKQASTCPGATRQG